MTTISYNQKCNKNKDCASNVCEMLYNQGVPQGRYCLESSGTRYTKSCNFPKDCLSGICSKIYDSNGHFVTKRCVRAPKRDLDTPFNNLANEPPTAPVAPNIKILLAINLISFRNLKFFCY